MTLDNNHHTDIDSAPKKQAQPRDVYKNAVKRLLAKLTRSVEADCHQPYLEDNDVGAHDLSVDRSGNLLAALIDLKASFRDNAYIPCPQNLLTITPDGDCRLEPRAKFYGGAVMIGHRRFRQIAKDRQGRHEIFITVDYATGAFLHEETGSPAAVAVKTCNMPQVYAALRAIFPNAFIVACLNYESDKQLMRKKALEEIRRSGGIALAPRLTLKERFSGLASFNDLAMFHDDRDMILENLLRQIQGVQNRQQGRTIRTSSSKSRKPRKPSACRKEVTQ